MICVLWFAIRLKRVKDEGKAWCVNAVKTEWKILLFYCPGTDKLSGNSDFSANGHNSRA